MKRVNLSMKPLVKQLSFASLIHRAYGEVS